MLIDSQDLRQALGRFATGVTLVTCLDDHAAPVGLTVNSFTALSLEPPLVLWSLRLASPSLVSFSRARHFAVNVLGQQQLELSRRFASPTPDRFAQGDWQAGEGGAPVLGGCLASFECLLESQQRHGDHQLFIGRVLKLTQQAGAPLVFQAGHYRHLGEAL